MLFTQCVILKPHLVFTNIPLNGTIYSYIKTSPFHAGVASVFYSLFVRNQMHRSQDMTKLCYQVTQVKTNNVSGSIFLAKRSIRFDLSNLFSFDISLCFLQYLLDNLLFGSITLRIQIHCIRLVAAFVNRGHAF